MVWPLLAAVGSTIAGGLLENKGASDRNQAEIASAREQMDFQREENKKAMDFSERMSNTSHQRAFADMKAAGLNPILAARSGASTPSGVTSSGAKANLENTMTGVANSARSIGDKLYNFAVQKETVNNMQLQNDLLKQQVIGQTISNTRSGIWTPVFDKAGQIVDKVASWGDKVIDQPGDMIGDVIKAVSSGATGISEGPSSAARQRAIIDSSPLGGSQASKFLKAEKGFFESLKDSANEAASASRTRATQEQLKRLGKQRAEYYRKKGYLQ